jgi:hypothetical protein
MSPWNRGVLGLTTYEAKTINAANAGGPEALRHLWAAAAVALGLFATAACGAGNDAAGRQTRTVTVTSVACDGSITTTVGALPAGSGSSGQVTPEGQVSPKVGVPATPTALPTPRAIRSNFVELTDGDDGSTIVVHVGTHIAIALGPATAPFCWSAATSSDARIVDQLSSTSGTDRSAHGAFVAHAVGTAMLQATSDPRCYPPCGVASALWRVTVEVAA